MSNYQPHRLPTMKDVAALTGFSQQTVHRALHAGNQVTPATRAKILKVVKEIGYRPNRAARLLATAKSSVVGIVSFATQIYGPAHTILSIDEVAKSMGLNIMLTSVPTFDPRKFRRAVAEIAEYGPLGIILLSPIRLTREFFEDWYHNYPMIVIGECATPGEFNSIDHDYATSTEAAVQHLADQGHTKIACLKGPADWTPTKFRSLGWENGLKKNGLSLGPCYEGDWTPKSGYEMTQTLIRERRGDFSAIVVQNDLMAFGVLCALHEHGIRVPEEVSVIGYDDMPESAYAVPPLTTLFQDYARIGQMAINTLLAAARQEKYEKNPLLDCPLMIRASSAPAKPLEPHVRTRVGSASGRQRPVSR